ncbi:MAG: hypothetical protein K6E22_05960 [Treponema sp.]|nr:hypothetical protein [Treponema sp.]
MLRFTLGLLSGVLLTVAGATAIAAIRNKEEARSSDSEGLSQKDFDSKLAEMEEKLQEQKEQNADLEQKAKEMGSGLA